MSAAFFDPDELEGASIDQLLELKSPRTLAALAQDVIERTMAGGEKKHGRHVWFDRESVRHHLDRVARHAITAAIRHADDEAEMDGEDAVDHLERAIVRGLFALAKIRAVRYAFLELGVDDGVIVARTDSLGAGLTKQIAFVREKGDIGDQYNSFLDCEEVDASNIGHGDVLITRDGKLMRPKRLPSNLYQFRSGTGEDRCVLDSITSLQNGADLLWIETEKPHIGQIGGMVNRIREVIPNAKLVYNNSPSFNWTLNFRQQVFDAWTAEGKDEIGRTHV